jgi:hypothetical protein
MRCRLHACNELPILVPEGFTAFRWRIVGISKFPECLASSSALRWDLHPGIFNETFFRAGEDAETGSLDKRNENEDLFSNYKSGKKVDRESKKSRRESAKSWSHRALQSGQTASSTG